MPAQTHVTIDGVSVPAQQALDAVRQLAAASEDTAGYLQAPLAQAVGPAVQQSQEGCAYVKKALKKYLAGLRKAVSNGAGALQYALGSGVGEMVQQSQQLRDTLTAGISGSNGARGLGASPSVPPSVPGGTMPPPPAGHAPLTGAGGAPAGGFTPALGPAQPPAGKDTFIILYQCHGTDGKPGAAVRVFHPPPQLGVNDYAVAGLPDFSSPFDYSAPFAGPDLNAALAFAGANFPQWVQANCQGAVVPPAQPAPPAAGSWNIYYQCLGCIDPQTGETFKAGVFPANPGNPWIVFSQGGINFPDQPTAQAVLDSWNVYIRQACAVENPQPCQAQPPPPPPPPVAPPPPGQLPVCQAPPADPCAPPVDKFDCANLVIPDFLVIGSKEFCDLKNQLRDNFTELGKRLVDTVSKVDPSSPLTENVAGVLVNQAGPLGELMNALWQSIISWVGSDSKRAVGLIQDGIKCWWQLLKTSKSCNITEVIYLAVVKGIVEILQRFRIGWDLIIWGTADVTVHVSPLVKVLDYLINDACPAEIPEHGDTIEAWIKGQITDEQAKCLLSLRGVAWDVWYPVIHARRETLTVEEYIQAARRGGADDPTILAGLRILGFTDAPEAAARLLVYDQLPNISDVLHFLQRNVFDPDYVRDFGLMDGFNERFWPRYGAGLRAIGVLESTARDHYAAHWINPSIGQLAEMVQRLRPGRVDPSVVFTPNDFLRVLAEQDVAPFFRERLRQISFRTLPLRQLTQLVQTRQIDKAELVQRWQDIGYKDTDALLLANSLSIQAERQRATQMRGYTPAVVSKLWPAGQITRQQAYAVLAPQGLQQADVDTLLEVSTKEAVAAQYEKHTVKAIQDYASLAVKAYEDGLVTADNAIAALQNAGYLPDAATLEIQSADLRVRMRNSERAAKAIYKAFLRGELSVSDAVNALVLAGFQPGAAGAQVSLWSLELTVPRKAASRAQILKWAKDGIISVANAETRLLNLGYSPDTVGLDILDLAQTIKAAQAAAASRRAAQLARAQAAAQRALTATQKAFCRLYTPGKMKLWYAERIIDENTYRDRLTKCGYSQEQIDLSFKEAVVAREKRDEQAAKKGSSGIEYTGSGADTGGGNSTGG